MSAYKSVGGSSEQWHEAMGRVSVEEVNASRQYIEGAIRAGADDKTVDIARSEARRVDRTDEVSDTVLGIWVDSILYRESELEDIQLPKWLPNNLTQAEINALCFRIHKFVNPRGAPELNPLARRWERKMLNFLGWSSLADRVSDFERRGAYIPADTVTARSVERHLTREGGLRNKLASLMLRGALAIEYRKPIHGREAFSKET